MRRALAILALARAYEVYENEYANDVLPGGRGELHGAAVPLGLHHLAHESIFRRGLHENHGGSPR